MSRCCHIRCYPTDLRLYKLTTQSGSLGRAAMALSPRVPGFHTTTGRSSRPTARLSSQGSNLPLRHWPRPTASVLSRNLAADSQANLVCYTTAFPAVVWPRCCPNCCRLTTRFVHACRPNGAPEFCVRQVGRLRPHRAHHNTPVQVARSGPSLAITGGSSGKRN